MELLERPLSAQSLVSFLEKVSEQHFPRAVLQVLTPGSGLELLASFGDGLLTVTVRKNTIFFLLKLILVSVL